MSKIVSELNAEMVREVKSNKAWRLECEQLRAELNEQARLLGISAEKELALRAENERLKAELAEAKKDVERYRWLRHGDNDEPLLKFSFEARCNSDDVWLLRNDELDAAIDAAMKGK